MCGMINLRLNRSEMNRNGVAYNSRVDWRANSFLCANIFLLAISLFAGGASRLNPYQAAVIELSSAVMLPWTLYRLVRQDGVRRLIWPMIIVLGSISIPLFQLIPLPPALWAQLPTFDRVENVYKAVGMSPPWHSISLTPDLTIRSAVALVTPVTIFLGWSTLSMQARRIGIGVILAFAAASLGLGMIQLAGGGGRALGYLYQNTNYGAMVGFFANRNHQASFLVCSLPFTAALLASSRGKKVQGPVFVIITVGLTITTIVAVTATLSRAGLLLLAPAVIAAAAILLQSRAATATKHLLLAIGGALAVAVVLVVAYGFDRIAARFETNPLEDSRFTYATVVFRAAMKSLPFGTGLGSFDSIYRSFEPMQLLSPAYLNHAHNEYLELLLEAGIPGVVLVVSFAVWFLFRASSIWFGRGADRQSLAKAGSVVIALLLAHSVLDYPLRTLTLSAIFGFALALCATPRTASDEAVDRSTWLHTR